ncbi:MAG: hypothetical protein AABZ30_14735 [Myxococcota bacterium]
MDAYREYLEIYEYFGRGGLVRLAPQEFRALDAEWRELRERHRALTDDERARFAELKRVLMRDRP